jgi:hypothetical protein
MAPLLKNLAAYYGQNHEGLPEARRIDVVAVEMTGNGRASRIEIIENAVSE